MGILKRARKFRNWIHHRFSASAVSIGVLWSLSGVCIHAKEVSLEYQVKAVYLFNFAKFIEWPAEGQSGPITICIAGQNPFGDVLEETLRGEMVNGRPLAMRVIAVPEPGCHVVFVPQGTSTATYLRAAQGSHTLTVGETPDFIRQGGIISFILESGKVRFQIDSKAAERAELRISSHLLRLARTQDRGTTP
jgi:uncharacterized protein DUF4154